MRELIEAYIEEYFRENENIHDALQIKGSTSLVNKKVLLVKMKQNQQFIKKLRYILKHLKP